MTSCSYGNTGANYWEDSSLLTSSPRDLSLSQGLGAWLSVRADAGRKRNETPREQERCLGYTKREE